jgi:hypothetical protein
MTTVQVNKQAGSMNLKHILFLEKVWTRQVSKMCPPQTDQNPKLRFKGLTDLSASSSTPSFTRGSVAALFVGYGTSYFSKMDAPPRKFIREGCPPPRRLGLDEASSRNLSDALEGMPSRRGSAAATGHTSTKGLPCGPGHPAPRPDGSTVGGQS